MKHTLHTLLLLGSASIAQAQLVNGSFEENGQGSLQNWNNSCSEAVLLPGGAPGCGDWHAGYPTHFGFGASCEDTHDLLYQELPGLSANYQNMIIGFWSRTNTAYHPEYFIAVEVRQSHIHDGQFFPTLNGGGTVMPSVDWVYNTLTIYNPLPTNPLHPDDTRAIGFIGYDTTGAELLELDGIEILALNDISTAVTGIDPFKVLGYYDPVNEQTVISRPLGAPMLCFDAAGRRVDLGGSASQNGTGTWSTASLTPGLYTAIAGQRSLRFVKQ